MDVVSELKRKQAWTTNKVIRETVMQEGDNGEVSCEDELTRLKADLLDNNLLEEAFEHATEDHEEIRENIVAVEEHRPTDKTSQKRNQSYSGLASQTQKTEKTQHMMMASQKNTGKQSS